MRDRNKPVFTVSRYDNEGDMTEKGIYLHFGEVAVRVAETMDEYHEFINHLEKIYEEINENYNFK